MNLKGSKTERNIKSAFQGESMARNRYSFYEEQAKKEGHEEVAAMFAKMGKNEMLHARLWYKLFNDGMDDSLTNIQEAAKGEGQEWTSMYPQFAATAREEGFEEVARLFDQVANIERDHEMSFLKAYAALRSKLSQKEAGEVAITARQEPEEEPREKMVYRCMFCGAIFDRRPDVCPVCEAIGSFETGTGRA